MRVVINPTNTISTRVSSQNQRSVYGTATFVGAGDAQAEIQIAKDTANTALMVASDAYAVANTANTNVTYIANELGDGTFDCGLF